MEKLIHMIYSNPSIQRQVQNIENLENLYRVTIDTGRNDVHALIKNVCDRGLFL